MIPQSRQPTTIDFDAVDQELLVNRGKYATVRSAHEKAKEDFAILCSSTTTNVARVLRLIQSDMENDMQGAMKTMEDVRKDFEEIFACAERIQSLSAQRAELKDKAWPKGRKE